MSDDKSKTCKIQDVKPGMKLGDVILDDNGKMILAEGTVVSDVLLQKLMQWGVREVKINVDEAQDSVKWSSTLRRRFNEDYGKTVTELKESFKTIRYFKQVPINEMKELANNRIDALVNSVGVINNLHMIKRTDDYTFHHSINVAVLSGVLGRWLGYNGENLKNLILAGLMHDVGKTQVPLEILNKADKLTDPEMKIMQCHTTRGLELLRSIPEVSYEVLLGVVQHHERMDGSGYPFGLSHDKIHPFAKIIAVADIYDAMTSDRVYHRKVTPFKVIEILLQEIFNKLDPYVCTTFLNNVRDYYLGNVVQLNDGRKAEVVYLGQFMASRPVVKTEDGEFIDLEKCKTKSIIQLIKG